MPQCQFPIFCCFCVLENYTGNILGIDETKARSLIFLGSFPETEREPEGG
jgi:hypothetical protein